MSCTCGSDEGTNSKHSLPEVRLANAPQEEVPASSLPQIIVLQLENQECYDDIYGTLKRKL